jgi:hypothetical protein
MKSPTTAESLQSHPLVKQALLEAVKTQKNLNDRNRNEQRQAIRRWRPWEKSTGPRSQQGKNMSSRNAWKGGTRVILRTLARLLRH